MEEGKNERIKRGRADEVGTKKIGKRRKMKGKRKRRREEMKRGKKRKGSGKTR